MADIVVCVDGTWCGPQTLTRTNTFILACSFADSCILEGKQEYGGFYAKHPQKDVHVLYLPGSGVNDDDISSYVVNAALALDIRERCCNAYRFIVDHFKAEQQMGSAAGGGTTRCSRIWLFGHSRGAHTVRSVAGMINNCGILKNEACSMLTLEDKAKEVYSMYRSRDPAFHPNTKTMHHFRAQHSVQPGSKPPVFFLGLLDTVGALGVPQLNAGASGVSYELYDPYVSSEVQHVWQGLAAHDRLTVFTPYFAMRKPNFQLGKRYPAAEYSCEEFWFPGAHYDIGRQEFVLLRRVPGHRLEWALQVINSLLNCFYLNVTFTPKLANAPLQQLVKAARSRYAADDIAICGALDNILPDAETEASLNDNYLMKWGQPPSRLEGFVKEVLKPGTHRVQTIDAYDHISQDAPLFQLPVVGKLLTTFLPIALNDRLIPLDREAHFCGDENAFTYCNQTKFISKSYQTYKAFMIRGADHGGAPGNASGGSGQPSSSKPRISGNDAEDDVGPWKWDQQQMS